MRKIIFLLPVICCFFLQSCLKEKITKTYSMYSPVYKSKTEVYANIKSNAPRSISSPGKLFLYGNYIFLNETDKGIHVIDNTNPANPVVKAFIDIPGNLDIAVKGNTLYADLYTDMVVVDITDPQQARFVKYEANVFPMRNYTNGFMADSSRVIVDWVKKDTTIDVRNERYYYDSMVFLSSSQGGSGSGGFSNGVTTGIAGSMARFSIVNDYLYAVNSQNLATYNISNRENPQRTSNQNVGWGIETIYPFNGKLFIGSTNGMFIYDIANPGTPVQLSALAHFRACDPVIADNNYAYVTLRGGNRCGTNTNQLDVVNVTNLQAPFVARTYPLTGPYGLTKDNNLLFVCDGTAGLNVYDATDPLNLTLKKTITGIETYDAIAWGNNLLVVAKDGLYQYDYSNQNDIVQRSKLSVTK
jgi:hypothetical protein